MWNFEYFISDGEVTYTECSDESGTIIVSKIQKATKVIETVITTHTGGQMEIVTDLFGKKTKQTGNLKFSSEGQSIWKVS